MPIKFGKKKGIFGSKKTKKNWYNGTKWYIDWKRAHFKLSLIKTVSGNKTLQLPAKLVNWILNTILPGKSL